MVNKEVWNDQLTPSEARIGVVDANRHPKNGSGSIDFFPRAKYWDF